MKNEVLDVSKREVVVITGASAGVGRATVREFARRGASIGLIARGEDGLTAARREVEAAGGRALVLPVDVANADAVEAAADYVEKTLGPIDIWVNNAMTSVFSPIKEMTAEDFKRVTEVTYLGYVYGSLAALKHMLPRDRGTIVHVGSALAYRSIPLQAAYCAAKHAVLGFFASLRTELKHDHSKCVPSWYKCRLSILRNLVGSRAVCRARRSRCHRFFSQKLRPALFTTPRIIPIAASITWRGLQ